MESEQLPQQPGNDIKQRRGGVGIWIAIVAIVTVIAVLLVPGEEKSDRSKAPLPPMERPSLLASSEGSASEGANRASVPGATTEKVPSVDAAASEPRGPGAAARTLIRKAQANPPVDLEALWEHARRFEEQRQLDDAYLLYYFTASRGYGPAAMKLGREADPAGFRPGGLFEKPDELQAHKWYRIAARAGIKEAEAALQVLRVRVEKAAAQGSERAHGLMLLWK